MTRAAWRLRIPRLRGGIALLVLLCCAAKASTLTEGLFSGSPFSDFAWSFDGQALTYGTALTRTPNSLLNPGNAFAGLPDLTLTGELRPNIKATSRTLDLVLQPRLTSVFQTGDVNQRESIRGYIQQGYVRARPDENISITAGRELLTWGPAFFRSPSNPYYFNNARLNPIVELSGIDLIRLGYNLGPNWLITGGIVFDSGQDLVPNNPYRNSFLFKVDYRGADFLGSLVLASLQSQQVFFGGYAQATVSDAILLYGEVGSSSNNAGLNNYPAGNVGWFSPAVSSQREATALAGGSYTFANGHSLYAEYLYNGFGYSGSGLQHYFQQAGSAGRELSVGGSLAGLATQNIGLAATRSVDLLGQHYLYLQYQNDTTQGDTLWRLMAAQNLVDHSAQLSAYLEHNLTNRVSTFALGTVDVGPRDTEFGAILGKSLLFGLKFFAF